VLKLGQFGKYIINSWIVLKCGAGVEWRGSALPIGLEMQYYMQSRRRGISDLQYEEGLTGLVTSGVVSAL
jgi:hypothetical protein